MKIKVRENLYKIKNERNKYKGYKDKIVDIREEILSKRRVGKLPGDTTSVLKAWWLYYIFFSFSKPCSNIFERI